MFSDGTLLITGGLDRLATNPYVNSPIGLSFVLMALFTLRTLAKGAKSDNAPTSASSQSFAK